MAGEGAGDAWREGMRAAHLYRTIAGVEAGTPREPLFRGLAADAEARAAKQGGAPSRFKPDLRTRIVAWLVRRFGPRATQGILATMNLRGLSVYRQPDLPPPRPATLEEMRERRRGSGSNLRAAVFGANDGLVSNASLMFGVAGATDGTTGVLLAGAAGLLAGAFSMAAGEYVSVTSQREVFEHEIERQRAELLSYPAETVQELARLYEGLGVEGDDAAALALARLADQERALDFLARGKLGLNPDELGSPWGAALSSFFSFAAGAFVPVAPFLFAQGNTALLVSVAAAACALFAIGATISLFTGRSALRDGLRMLAIGGGAGAATYLVGRLLGVTLS
ncbi:MAG: VIT1/CCC1 transporter family protein [Burkholderiales bacterium]